MHIKSYIHFKKMRIGEQKMKWLSERLHNLREYIVIFNHKIIYYVFSGLNTHFSKLLKTHFISSLTFWQ